MKRRAWTALFVVLTVCGTALFSLGACAGKPPAPGVVEVCAFGGYNSVRLKTVVEERLTSGPQFQYAIIMVGTNDSLVKDAWVHWDKYRENVHGMLQKIADYGATPLIAEIPPQIEEIAQERKPWLNRRPANHVIEVYNQEVHRAAKALQPPAEVISIYDKFLPHATLKPEDWISADPEDGVHPTVAGNRAIGEAYAAALRGKDIAGKRIVLFGDSIMVSRKFPGQGPGDFLQELLNGTGGKK